MGRLRALRGDFLLFGNDPRTLWAAREQIATFLAALRLTLHPRKTRVLPVAAGVPFLGFVHTPGRVRIKRDAVSRFRRRMRRYRGAFAERALGANRLSASVQSWVAHAAYGQTYRLRRVLLSDLVFSRGS